MNKIRKRILGKWQIKMLQDIEAKRVCCHLRAIEKVGGTAKTWRPKYERSLKRAIEAHNLCITVNSPIDPKWIIVLEGCGYVLQDRSTHHRYSKYSPERNLANGMI